MCGPSAALAASPPEVKEEAATDVGATAAKLRATIAPNGSASTYFFQYGTVDTEGCTSVDCVTTSPVKLNALAGEVRVPEEAKLQGLSPLTTYHYHVVTVAEVEVKAGEVKTVEVHGPDKTFITQWTGPSELPDGREWEMVSPEEKLGSRIATQGEPGSSEGNVIQSAANGHALTFVAYAPTEANPKGYDGDTQIFASRGAAGWHSWDLNLPHETATGGGIGKGNEYRFFSEDLSVAFLQPFGPLVKATPQEEAEPLSPNDIALAPAEASEQTAFLHQNYLNGDPNQRCERPLASCFKPLVTDRPGGDVPFGTEFGEEGLCPPETFCGPEFLGASADGAYAVVKMRPNPGQQGLYEWHEGKLTFIAEHAELGSHNSGHTRNAVSDDGSRVIYVQGGDLFSRDTVDNTSVQVDLAEPGCPSCTSGGRPAYQDASSDGSRIFFTDTARLTADAGAETAEKGKRDLYECHIVDEGAESKCALTDLTPKSGGGESADVVGLMIGSSEDGSWAYFVANGVLENAGVPVAGAVRGNCIGEAGRPNARCNLYVRHDGVTSLVAVLAGADRSDWGVNSDESGLELLVARVSPNGHWLAFMSNDEPTGYDSHDVVSGERDEEVYLYSTETNAVVCASCNPTGALPQGERFRIEGTETYSMPLITRGGWEQSTWLSASLPGWTPHRLGQASYQSRFLENNGRLYFDSDDALVPTDENKNWDVYQYEPVGVGSCVDTSRTFNEASRGCIDAISPGTTDGESDFVDASATGGSEGEGNEGGGDVFFVTASKLAPQEDTDDALDVYDARECTTAEPCATPAAEQPKGCASVDGCRGAPPAPPAVFNSPASSLFAGPGNDPAIKVVTKPQTKTAAQIRKERLAKALKACRAKKNRQLRKNCEKTARKRYAAKTAAKRPVSATKRGAGK
jgi:hypothetical protein